MKQPICTTSKFGTVEYRLNGWLHRTDGPAAVEANGSEAWYKFGKLHRTDGPAYVRESGYQAWYRKGKKHRTDGLAVIYPDGTEEFWLNGDKVDIMVHFLQRK